MTLETMNPPIPAHVRAAISNRDADFTEATGNTEATDNTDATGSAARSGFDAAVRATAPGRRRPSEVSAKRRTPTSPERSGPPRRVDATADAIS